MSLSYDVKDHVYSKSKPIYHRTDLVYIEVIRVFTLSYTDLYGYWLRF